MSGYRFLQIALQDRTGGHPPARADMQFMNGRLKDELKAGERVIAMTSASSDDVVLLIEGPETKA